jgi:hypothetical protein
MEQQTDSHLSAEAGLTESAARAAGSHGVADPDLHVGFITKQTPMDQAKPLKADSSTHEEKPVTDQGITPEPLEEGTALGLDAEAGLTAGAARAAGTSGYADDALHAGFITKQTPMETLGKPSEYVQHPTAKHELGPQQTGGHELALEPLEEGKEPALSGEAGLTVASAKAAGAHGYADPALGAGFISKQTGIPRRGDA